MELEWPIPKNDADFEELCLDIAKEYQEHFGDKDAHLYAKRGQSQNGIDIYLPSKEKGIQSKKKESGTKKIDLEKDIRGEVDKACGFEHPLKEYYILSTVKNHKEVQDEIILINQEHKKSGKFEVRFWGWDTIEKILNNDCPKALRKYMNKATPTFASNLTESYVIMLKKSESFVNSGQFEQALNLLQLIEEAKPLLSSEDLLYLRKIKARALAGVENVQEAIQLYEEILRQHSDLECLLDLYEIYNNLGLKDKSQEYFNLAEKFAPQSDKILIHKLIQDIYAKKEVDLSISFPSEPNEWGKLLIQLSLKYHGAGNSEIRDQLLNKLESIVPNSPRPEFLRTVFSVDDALLKEDALTAEKLFYLSSQILTINDRFKNKNSLSKRNLIYLMLQHIKIYFALQRFKPSVLELVQMREKIITEILECNFDIFSENILEQVLTFLLLEEEQFLRIKTYIQSSNYKISDDLAVKLLILFVIYKIEFSEIEVFSAAVSNENISKLFKLIKKEDSENFMMEIANFSEDNRLLVIQSILNPEFALKVIESALKEVNIAEAYKNALMTLKIAVLFEKKLYNEVINLVEEINVNKANYYLLNVINSAAVKEKRHDIENLTLKKIIKLDLSGPEKSKYFSGLAYSNLKLRQYDEAFEYATKALELEEKNENINPAELEKILLTALIHASNTKKALELLDKYKTTDDLQLTFVKSEILIKEGQNPAALDRIREAFKKIESFTPEQYFDWLPKLNSLDIPTESKSIAEDGDIVKIEGNDRCFVIGAEKNIVGCVAIPTNDHRYNILKKAELGSVVKFNDGKPRKIEFIYDLATYLLSQAFKSMQILSDQGESYVRSFEVPKDPKKMIESLKEQFEEINKNRDNFFKSYTDSPFIPFSFLIKREGNIWSAISRLKLENHGFLRINAGGIKDMEYQKSVARQIINSGKLVLDGTSALFLSMSGCLENVLNKFHVIVPRSVITMFQDLATELTPIANQLGKVGMKNGVLFASNINIEEINKFRKFLLDSAELIKLKSELIDSVAASPESNKYLVEQMSPAYITDAVIYAKKNNCAILSEDFNYLALHEVMDKIEIIPRCSSYFLTQEMLSDQLINKDQYLEHFKVLADSKAYILNISADIIWAAIFSSSNGIVNIIPENIHKLNLKYTLSKEYGVSNEVAFNIMANFILKVIKDSSIPAEIANKIFYISLENLFLPYRDIRSIGQRLMKFCEANITIKSKFLIVPADQASKQKLKALSESIKTFYDLGYNMLPEIKIIK